MKTLCTALIATLALAATCAAAPRLLVSTPSITPECSIQVIFDLPLTAPSELGKTLPNTWLEASPALPGKLIWKAQNIAQLVPDQVPAMGTTYQFSITKDLRHLDGSAIPTGVFGSCASEPLQVRSATTQNRWSADFSPATAEWLVFFNDDINPTTAAPFVAFVSKSGQQVAAKVVQATVARTGQDPSSYRSWAERGKQPAVPAANASAAPTPVAAPAPETPTPNAIIASPLTPLPPGEDWNLVVRKGLPNKSADTRVLADSAQQIGTIEPFQVENIAPRVTTESPREIIATFNQLVPKPLPADFLTTCVTLTPRPANLSASVEDREVHLHGNFADTDKFTLTIKPPFESKVGHPLSAPLSKEFIFERLDPELILPSHDQAQLASGSRSYRLQTVNLTDLHVRIKQLSGLDAIRAYQGYRNYSGAGPDHANIEKTAPLPYSLVAGATLPEQKIPLGNPIDTAKEITLHWDELLPKDVPNAILFLDATGTPNPILHKTGHCTAQAIIQLTDIGLAWKITAKDAFIYAFSCATGKPLPGVSIEIFGEDAVRLSTAATDASGLLSVARPKAARHLRASLGQDAFITAFDTSLEIVGLWHFPVHYSWQKVPEAARRAFLFTDRSLYRPGETVRLKGIVRTLRGNTIETNKPAAARIVVIDPTEKEIFTQPVSVSATGSFDLTYTLPTTQTGTHLIRLEYPAELAAAKATEDWEEKEILSNNATFEIPLRVEEFRRNAFEITQTIAPPTTAAATVQAALSARYYQGQAVAAGKVKYHTRITDNNPYPDRFRDFLFGNHRSEDWRYWYHYFAFRWSDEGDGEGSPGVEVNQQQGETMLSADGKTSVSVPLPQTDFPTAREVVVASEVTDANNQTLSARTSVTVHPASIYIGISRVDSLVRAGEELPLQIVAITPDGKPITAATTVKATLTREINNAVKAQTDSGATTTRNDVHEETVSTTDLTIEAGASAAKGQLFKITPRDSGLHFLTLRGTDAGGHAFATVTSFHVYGTKEFPWLYEDGLRVKLVAEKKSYRPGETARILVLSPIAGTALVTVEREKVLRSFLTELKADNPVIEIPLSQDDAPNACVSVLIIKGARDSARQHKEPQLRLGYCELLVDDLRDRLAVTLAASSNAAAAATQTITTDAAATPPTFRPGDKVTLTGTVSLPDGTPAADAELTLYAEDEGTLAVMGYDTPDPMAFFYAPRFLSVDTGTSFATFISENPELQQFFNKGFFIGGGDDLSKLAELMRKNFDPCATWAPVITTDAAGKFTHSFKVPDTLTRYRVIAIAQHQAARFGSTESAILVNKPLMLEPKTPRFAYQGDSLNPQVLVQNASEFSGTWSITYKAHAASGTPVCRALSPATQTVNLAPGASATLIFPSVMENTGEAVSSWQAIPVSLSGKDLTPELTRSLSDSVEARYPVTYPMPLLRQYQFVKFDKPGAKRNLLENLDQTLLDGSGELNLEFSTSPLTQAAGAVDYLLQYPYGCVEQSTSALMPWFTVGPLRSVVPAFANIPREKVTAAIQTGANRLLTMQLTDGSFTYWPGGTETAKWANSYASLGLILASKNGANVPASAIEKITTYLTTSLRGLAKVKSSSELDEAARTLWVLALAGKPQAAYQNLMEQRLADLSPSARCLLALAIVNTGAKNDIATAKLILSSKKPATLAADGWMPYTADDSLKLLAWTAVDFKSKTTTTALDRLLNERNPYGHWHNTWLNSWSLLAISSYAGRDKADGSPSNLTLDTADASQAIQLTSNKPTAALSFPLSSGLKLDLTNDKQAFLRLRLAAKPKIAPLKPVATNGLSIDRFYERINANGTLETLTEPAVGDLIRVSLRVSLPKDDTRYLVIEDPLSALFETVNSDFKSQSSALGIGTSENNWSVSHSELRSDRAMFFLDEVGHRGTYTLTYLVRCTLAGESTAPPAKVESMYDPSQFALSASRSFRTK